MEDQKSKIQDPRSQITLGTAASRAFIGFPMLGQNQASPYPRPLGARVAWTIPKLARAQTTKEFLKLLDCNLEK